MNNLFDQYAEYIMSNCAGERSHATYTKEYRLAPPDDDSHSSRQAWRDLLDFLRAHLPPPHSST